MQKEKDEIRRAQQKLLSVGMKRLVVQFRGLMEGMLEQEGMTLAQLRMLYALGEQPNTSAAELARICYVTPQSMQSIVTRAEASGWIRRTASPTNRRVLVAALTPAGRRVLQRAKAIAARIEQEIWADAKVPELTAMNRTLSTALEKLEQLHERHAPGAARGKTA